MIRLSDQVYVETKYYGANVGCVVTDEGLVLIDSPMIPEDARDWREQLKKISDRDIAYLISMEYHLDHGVLGNCLWTERIIAHQLTSRAIKRYLEVSLEQDFLQIFHDLEPQKDHVLGNMKVVLPQITFSQRMTLNMGNRNLELTHVAGHSPSMIMVHIPEDKILFVGDNIETGQLSWSGQCRFSSWIEMLRSVEQMDVEALVPGHGDLCGVEQARKMRIYLEEMRDQVARLRDAGHSREEIIQKVDLKDFLPLEPSLRQAAAGDVAESVGRMYDQLEKQ